MNPALTYYSTVTYKHAFQIRYVTPVILLVYYKVRLDFRVNRRTDVTALANRGQHAYMDVP